MVVLPIIYKEHLEIRADIINGRDRKIVSVYDRIKDGGYEVWLLGKLHVKPEALFKFNKEIDSVNKFVDICEFKKALDDHKNKEITQGKKIPLCIFVASDLPHFPLKTHKPKHVSNSCNNYSKQKINTCVDDNDKYCYKKSN